MNYEHVHCRCRDDPQGRPGRRSTNHKVSRRMEGRCGMGQSRGMSRRACKIDRLLLPKFESKTHGAADL